MQHKVMLLDQLKGELAWSAPQRVAYLICREALFVNLRALADDVLLDEEFTSLLDSYF